MRLRFNIKNYRLILGIGFGLLTVLLALSGSSIVFIASDIQNDIQLIQDNYTSSVRLIGQVETDVNMLRILVSELIVTPNVVEKNQYTADIDSLIGNIVNLLSQTQKITILPREMDTFQKYILAFDNYVDAVREVIDTAKAGHNDAAEHILQVKLLPYKNKLGRISKELVDTNIQAAQTTRAHIKSLEMQFLISGSAILLLSVLLSLFIYLFVLRQFRNYIQNITAAQQEREKLLRMLTERQKKIEQLLINLSTVEENQRKRFSQELHDAIGHGLTIAKFYTDSARSEIPKNPAVAQEHLNNALATIKSTLAESKRISYELRPTLLDDFGLPTAVDQFVNEFQERTGVAVRADVHLQSKHLPPLAEINLYRIIQEVFMNVEKHAHAKKVVLQMIQRDNGTVALSITDDGCGFSTGSVAWNEEPAHFGLRNILERGELIGGTVLIESQPGKGTEINIELPLELSEIVV